MTAAPVEPDAVLRALRRLAQTRNADVNALMVQYAIERFLQRLSSSSHGERFVLKGALLFRAWTGELLRPTRDVDLLGTGSPRSDAVRAVLRDALGPRDVPDGVQFEVDGMRAAEIRIGRAYGGAKVTITARIGHVPIVVRADVGFGDAVTPPARRISFAALLGHPDVRLRAYPPETVVAEKLEAICALGFANTRLKDYYDLLAIGRLFEFRGDILAEAVRRTFQRRGTELPTIPPCGLSAEFAADDEKRKQWTAFLSRSRLTDAPTAFEDAVKALREFFSPLLGAARGGRPAPSRWRPLDGWVEVGSPQDPGS